jgi:2-dehydro-3-deoxygluconokinase
MPGAAVHIIGLLLNNQFLNLPAMEKKVCCFGELLLRLSPDAEADLAKTSAIPFFIGGAELNVATALANWETAVRYITVLPDNYLSGQLIKYIDQKKVDSSCISFCGNRIGIYYLPVGFDLKNTIVLYDRDHTSFSTLKPGVIDWDKVLSGCSWFHFSAISPALNDNVAAVCKEALEVASAKGLTISVDLNYREKLWQYGKAPQSVMPPLVKYCHVIMGNLWAVESLLGIPSSLQNSEGKTQEQLTRAAIESMQQVHKVYPNATTFAYTFRMENLYWAVLQHGQHTASSNKYVVEKVMDKVGSGDCFMAGLIYGLVQQHAGADIIDFAAAAAVGKLYEAGDATRQTIADIKQRTLR